MTQWEFINEIVNKNGFEFKEEIKAGYIGRYIGIFIRQKGTNNVSDEKFKLGQSKELTEVINNMTEDDLLRLFSEVRQAIKDLFEIHEAYQKLFEEYNEYNKEAQND